MGGAEWLMRGRKEGQMDRGKEGWWEELWPVDKGAMAGSIDADDV